MSDFAAAAARLFQSAGQARLIRRCLVVGRQLKNSLVQPCRTLYVVVQVGTITLYQETAFCCVAVIRRSCLPMAGFRSSSR